MNQNDFNKVIPNSKLISVLNSISKFGGPGVYQSKPLTEKTIGTFYSLYLLDQKLGCFFIDDFKLLIAYGRQGLNNFWDEVLVYQIRDNTYTLSYRFQLGSVKSLKDKECKVMSAMARNLVKRIAKVPNKDPEFFQALMGFEKKFHKTK